MKFKSYPIQIWFLDEDLIASAKYQTNKSLNKSIIGCMQALITARFYFIGIRNQKFYKFYFNKENKNDTMERFFPLWLMHKPPMFQTYTSKTSKWCRKCNEHYSYVKQYLDILLTEYEYRFGKQHQVSKFLDWEECDAPKLNIPNANIKKINIEWKVLNPKWRRSNIIDGYRLQFMNSFEKDAFDEYNGTKRDIPEFVLNYFNLNVAGIC